jgi:hypothetical protein
MKPIEPPGWILPHGEFLESEPGAVVENYPGLSGHARAAVEWLRQNDPKTATELERELANHGLDPLDGGKYRQVIKEFMFRRGWVRLAGDYTYFVYEGNPSAEQLSKIEEAARILGADVVRSV